VENPGTATARNVRVVATIPVSGRLAAAPGVDRRLLMSQKLAKRRKGSAAALLVARVLVRFGDPAVADAFCASRLGNDWGSAFGTLPAGTDFERIVERHTPAL